VLRKIYGPKTEEVRVERSHMTFTPHQILKILLHSVRGKCGIKEAVTICTFLSVVRKSDFN
jgi:hypothetical protein